MKFLLINQAFYPDTVATSQQLTDTAHFLSKKGCEVSVVTSRRRYENRSEVYKAKETFEKVRVYRVWSTGFGKKSLFSRVSDSLTFLVSVFFKILFLPRQDYLIACTSPPLLGAIVALATKLKGGKLIQWNYDLHPEAAVTAGYLNRNSIVTQFLFAVFRFILRESEFIVSLDRVMAKKIEAQGADPKKLLIIPPWSVQQKKENPSVNFLKEHGIENKFIILYSGNFSIVHPIETLLKSAVALKEQKDILFLFIGGGFREQEVRRYIRDFNLCNVKQLPFQPREILKEILLAADLPVVLLGEKANGISHPSKVYSILASGKPFVYVGPKESAIGDLQSQSAISYQAEHGEVEKLVSIIEQARTLDPQELTRIADSHLALAEQYSKSNLLRGFLNHVLSPTSHSSLCYLSAKTTVSQTQ